jgi:hypothetical protein
MSYYRERRQALIDIDCMAKQNLSVTEIIYKISLKYGFGKKIVVERLKILDEMDLIDGKKVFG